MPASAEEESQDMAVIEHEKIDLFARAYLEAVDTVTIRRRAGGQVDVDDNDDESQGWGGAKERQEVMALCEAFQDSPNIAGKGAGGAGGAAVSVAAMGGGVVKKFDAQDASFLVDRLCKYPRGEANSAVRLQWERDVIVGIKVLKVLAKTWRSAVSEEAPPSWLLEGVPRLLVQMLSTRDAGDRVVVCSLELGIEILHGGNDKFQNSLHDIMTKHLGAPDLFAHLQDRLRRAEDEGRTSKRISFEQVAPRATMEDLIRVGKERDLHGLIVQAAKNDPRLETSHVRLVMRFLHLLCEGHNEKLQNFLRHQPSSSRAVDMISGIANYVDAVTPYINPRIVGEVTTAMSALSEFVQNPCRPNQRVLVDTRLCACANEILDMKNEQDPPEHAHGNTDAEGGADHEYCSVLQWVAEQGVAACCSVMQAVYQTLTHNTHIHTYTGADHGTLKQTVARQSAKEARAAYQGAINELKAATATTLLSLLECVDQPYIPERMLASLDSNRLIDNMNGLLKLYNPWLLLKLRDQHEAGEIQLNVSKHMDGPFDVSLETMEEGADLEAEGVAQHYYITFITLASFDKTGRLSKRCTPEYIWDLANLRQKVGVIEISRKGLLEKAYFIVPRVCQYLTEASKRNLVVGVNRANLQTQLTEFADVLEPFYDEMRHQEQLTMRSLLNIFRLTSEFREKMFFLNACIINVFILIFYAYECNGSFICGDDEDLITYKIKPGGKEVVLCLSLLQCFLAVTRQWWYVIERGIPLVSRKIRQHRHKPPTNRLWAVIVALPSEQSDPTFRHRRIAQVQRGGLNRFKPRKIDLVVRPIYLMTDVNLWVITIMLLANLLALTLDAPGAPLFLLVHLMEIFSHSAILRNVIQSITYRGQSLVQTAILLIFMYYFFGVVGFLVFPEKFRLERPDVMGGRKLDPNNNGARCTSIWKCTLVVLDMVSFPSLSLSLSLFSLSLSLR